LKVFLKIGFFILAYCGLCQCSDTQLGENLSLSSNRPDEIIDGSDNTPPELSGNIIEAFDSQVDRHPTSQWPTATDNQQVSHYQIAIAFENGNSQCESADLENLALDWKNIPKEADFQGAGYQLISGELDGDGETLSFNLLGDTPYCTAVRAVDENDNFSNPILSQTPWLFYYLSCRQALENEPSLTDGVQTIDPDGVSGSSPSFDAFCDMTSDGGGWTLVIRYDASLANGTNYFLPTGSARTFLNSGDLASLNNTGNLSASANFIPFIENGATMLMHIAKPNDGAIDSSTYVHRYYSEIYQSVIDDPTRIFDPSLDTDSGGVVGSVVDGTSAIRRDRWFESDMTLMTVYDTDGDTSNRYRISGGEGLAMWTNGNREGAVYCTAATSNAEGHGDPKVNWGFVGLDGDTQGYGGTTNVGTHCSSGLSCAPAEDINLMFIR
jgi:hypothetical protein